jgi:hypothetical protein
MNDTPLECPAGDAAANDDEDHCNELLRPVFRTAISSLAADDRLLIKLLVLDEVPQYVLAEHLSIHKGNVTRRRQRAVQRIWSSINASREASSEPRQIEECLELVLAGKSVELRRALGNCLSSALGGPSRSETVEE